MSISIEIKYFYRLMIDVFLRTIVSRISSLRKLTGYLLRVSLRNWSITSFRLLSIIRGVEDEERNTIVLFEISMIFEKVDPLIARVTIV